MTSIFSDCIRHGVGLGICAAALLSQAVFARDFVVALSPFQEPARAMRDVKIALNFATRLEPSDRLRFVDGYHLVSLGEFEIPDKPAYRHPKARLQYNGKTVKRVLDFARSAKIGHAGNNEPSIAGAVKFPQLMRYLADHYGGSDSVGVIVVGSPLYDHPKEPAFSMAKGLVPSDGHLRLTLHDTPYGTKGLPRDLANLAVYFAYASEGFWVNSRQKEAVKRFWALYLNQQGGSLHGFAAGLEDVLAQAGNGTARTAYRYTLDETQDVVMNVFKTVVLTEAVEVTPTPAPRVIEENKTLPQISTTFDAGVEIGITWNCAACDLDLYARPWQDAKILHYKSQNSDQGYFQKDHQESPRATQGFETITFTVPIDLKQLRVAVNFFAGRARSGVDGQIRITSGGQTMTAPFHIAASEGNAAYGVDQAMDTGISNNPAIVMIDPLSVMNQQYGRGK